MSCENCLNRRAFLAKSAAAAAAAALVADGCGNGVFGPPLPSHCAGGVPSGTLTIKVSDQPGLANGRRAGAIRRARREASWMQRHVLCAVADLHASGLRRRGDSRRNIVECPCHHSRFNSDGTVINGPDNSSPTSIHPLAQLPTSYNPQTDELTIG